MDSISDMDMEDEQMNIKKENIKKRESYSEEDDDSLNDAVDFKSDSEEEIQQKKKPKKQRKVVLPLNMSKQTYRACYICHLIKNTEQWRSNSCENCSLSYDKLRQQNIDSKHLLVKYTGHIAIMNTTGSWVAQKIIKQLDNPNIVPGLYALHVQEIDQDSIEELLQLEINPVQNSRM